MRERYKTVSAYPDYDMPNIPTLYGAPGFRVVWENLTPHAIVVGNRTITPRGVVARCEESGRVLALIDGFPIKTKSYGGIIGLPDPHEVRDPDGVIRVHLFVTSALVAQAAWAIGRKDVFCPGDPIRDEKGNIIGANCLCGSPGLAD